MSERICPVTGKPCDEVRVYELTEIKGDASFTVKCCRKCAVPHIEDLNKRAKAHEHPMLPSAMDFLHTLMGDLGVLNMETTELGLVIPIQPDNSKSKIIVKKGQPVERTCPGCGSTIHDLMGNGKVGCAQCYDFYREEMKNVVPNSQYGATSHIGKKSPKLKQDEVDLEALRAVAQTQLDSLRKKLEAAILDENYETAASLRDQIGQLQKKHGLS